MCKRRVIFTIMIAVLIAVSIVCLAGCQGKKQGPIPYGIYSMYEDGEIFKNGVWMFLANRRRNWVFYKHYYLIQDDNGAYFLYFINVCSHVLYLSDIKEVRKS